MNRGATESKTDGGVSGAEASVRESINIEELEKLIIEAEASVKGSVDQDLVLVIGATGSGKSTLINYMNGGEMVSLRDAVTGDTRIVNKIADTDSARFPEIGDGPSKTIFPKGYLSPLDHHFCFCDTSGFGDTRGIEHEICAHFSMQIVLRAAKRIKAILVVIDERALDIERALRLHSVMDTVGKLLGDPAAWSSTFFVFAQGHRTTTQIVAKLGARAKDLETDLDNPVSKEAHALLRNILARTHNIVKIDPLDGGKGGRNLITRIQDNRVISKAHFKVISDKREHAEVKRYMLSLAMAFNNAHESILESLEAIQKTEQEIQKAEESIKKLEMKMRVTQAKEASDEAMLADLNGQIQKHEKSKEDLEVQCAQKELEIRQLLDKISGLEKDNSPVEIYKDSFDERVKYGEVFKGTANTYIFEHTLPEDCDLVIEDWKYKGCGLLEVKEGEGERFEEQKKERKYRKLLYITPTHYYGKATFSLYTCKKFSIESKTEIQQAGILLEKCKSELARLRQEKKNIEEEITRLGTKIFEVSSGSLKTKQTQIDEFSKQRDFYQHKVDAHRKEYLKYQLCITVAQRTLSERDSKFRMFVRLSSFYPKEESIKIFRGYYADRYVDRRSEIPKPYNFDDVIAEDAEASREAPSGGGGAASAYASRELERVHRTVLSGGTTSSTPKIEGLIYQEMPGDDHCLFHAVGIYTGQNKNSLRDAVASYIEKHLDEFREQILAINPGRTPEQYLAAVRANEWADNLEIIVLMKIHNRPIVVIGPDGKIRNKVDFADFSGEPIFVYYNAHNHYDAYLLAEGWHARANEIIASLIRLNEHSREFEASVRDESPEHAAVSFSSARTLTAHASDVALNFQKLKRLLSEAQQSVRKATHKDVVLVIGLKESGKSTLVNYLNGGKMASSSDETGDLSIVNLLRPNPDFFPLIGHQHPKPLYPAIYFGNTHPYSLSDTPDMASSSLEEALVNSLALRMVVEVAKSIKAVVVVIDEDTLILERGNSLLALLDLLSHLFHDSISFEKSVKFVFNRGHKTIEQIRGTIKKAIDSKKTHPDENSMQEIMMLEILGRDKTLMKVDFLKPESRSDLLNFFKHSEPIPRERFNFGLVLKHASEVEGLVNQIIREFFEEVGIISVESQTQPPIRSELELIARDLLRQEESLRGLEGSLTLDSFKKRIDDEIQYIEQDQKELSKENDRYGQLIEAEKKSLGALESDESPVLYAEESFPDIKTKFKIIIGYDIFKQSHIFEYPRSKLPHSTAMSTYVLSDGIGLPVGERIYDYEGHTTLGNFALKENTKDLLKVEYTAPRADFGRAVLKIFIKKSWTPASQHEILIFKKKIKYFSDNIERNKIRIQENVLKIKKLHENQAGSIADYESESVHLKESIIESIEQLTARKKDLESMLSHSQNLEKQARQRIEKHKKNYQMVLYLEKFIEKSQFFCEFKQKYLELHPEDGKAATVAMAASEFPDSSPGLAVGRGISVPSVPGLKYQSIPGDGHCLFHAVALYVGQDQALLRNIVATYIENNLDEFRETIKAINPDRTLEQYLSTLRSGMEWADNLEISVLMKILNRPIVVIGPDGKIRNSMELSEFAGEPIFVYYNGHDHYDAYLLLEGWATRAREILTSLLDAHPWLVGAPIEVEKEHAVSTIAYSDSSFFSRKKLLCIVNLTGNKEFSSYLREGIVFTESYDSSCGDIIYEERAKLSSRQLSIQNDFSCLDCSHPWFIQSFSASPSGQLIELLSKYSTETSLKFVFLMRCNSRGIDSRSVEALKELIVLFSGNPKLLTPYSFMIAFIGLDGDLALQSLRRKMLEYTLNTHAISLVSRMALLNICDDGSSRENIFLQLRIGQDQMIGHFFPRAFWFNNAKQTIVKNKKNLWMVLPVMLILGWLYRLDYKNSSSYGQLLIAFTAIAFSQKIYRYLGVGQGIFSRALDVSQRFLLKLETSIQEKDTLVDQILRLIAGNLVESKGVVHSVGDLVVPTRKLIQTINTSVEEILGTLDRQITVFGTETRNLAKTLGPSILKSIESLNRCVATIDEEIKRNGKASEKLLSQLETEITTLNEHHGRFMASISQAANAGKFKPTAEISLIKQCVIM